MILPFSFEYTDVTAAFNVFGIFWFSLFSLIFICVAAYYSAWRWLPLALAVLAFFVLTRTLSYPAALFGADQPDWWSFYDAYRNDPTAHPSLVLFTTKLGIGLVAQVVEWGLDKLSIAQVNPRFLVSGRASGMGFDILVACGMCGLSWMMLPKPGRPWLVAVLGGAQAFVPAHLYMSTTISYNILADFCLLLTLFASLACHRVLVDMLAAIGEGAGKWLPLLVRMATAIVFFGVSLTLLMGAKWLFPPVMAVFCLQLILALVSVDYRSGSEKVGLSIFAITWVQVSMVVFSLAFYFLVIAPKVIGSGDHFSRNFAFFSQAISVGPLTEPWVRFKTLMGELMAPNVGAAAVVLAVLGALATSWRAWVRRDHPALLVHAWAALVLAQSVVSDFTTMTSTFNPLGLSAMTRSTMLMGVLQLYAVLACGMVLSLPMPTARRLVTGCVLGLVVLAEVVANGLAYTMFAQGERPFTHLARTVSAMPPGTRIGVSASPQSWCLPFQSLVRTPLDLVHDPKSTGPATDHDLPPYWVTSSCDGVQALWQSLPVRDAQTRARLSDLGYKVVERYEAKPEFWSGQLRRVLMEGRFFGLHQPSYIELWQRQ